MLASLKNGPLRKEIEDAGGLKLVYIDPPFDVGADFSFLVEVGGNAFEKLPSTIEEIAYRDTWGRGLDSYASMIHERLSLIRSVMADDASLLIHLGIHVNDLVRILAKEVFGAKNIISEVIWSYGSPSGGRAGGTKLVKVHEYILHIAKNYERRVEHKIYLPYSQKYLDEWFKYKDYDGRRYRIRLRRNSTSGENVVERQYLDESPGVPASTVWNDIQQIYADPRAYKANQAKHSEITGFSTQKPERLLERIILHSSNEGDLIGDFFCGSGTTMAVAEKLGRKWIGCDLSRFAIHTSRKRLIGVQRQLKAEGKPYRSFEILTLGKYERQYFVGIDPNLPEDQRRVISRQKEEQYLSLILGAYKAERVMQMPPFHGRKGDTLLLIGPVDAPVTHAQVAEAVEACRKLHVSRADVLGFEFEMGLAPHAQDEAKAKGVSLALRYIPREVFDKRAVEKGQVTFYDVAYIEVHPRVKARSVTVTLKDFAVYYRQDALDALAASLKNGAAKVTVDGGQVVKVTKDRKGIVTREVLTKNRSDWIDYWAVDFDFESRPETIRVMAPDAGGRSVERQQWTGGWIFENEWQSFRTRRDRSLELTSAPHEYPEKGRYKIAVKVIDIFGNDTTKVIEVAV